MADKLSLKSELWIKIIGLIISVLAVIGVVASIYYGLESQTNAINNQWGQEFYKQKMNVYLKASEAASRIAYLKANSSDSVALEKTILEFRTLYGGPTAIMEEPQVETAMVYFNRALDKNYSDEKLQQLALYLSHILRNESRSTFLNEKEPSSSYGNNEQLLARMANILNQ